MTVQIMHGNALNLPLPDESVDLVCTSPPYFGLRSYQDGGQHYTGQLGSEATPAEFVDALLAATREMVRVLKPSGSIWVNLGDKYAGSQPSATRWHTGATLDGGRGRLPELAEAHAGTVDVAWGTARPKSLLGIPWRYALACIDQLGLILRAEIIWNKPNGLPESVTDRVRRSHEQWFHFVRQPRYYSAVDEIREPHAEPNGRPSYGRERPVIPGGNRGTHVGTMNHAAHRDMDQSPLGKLPGSVWNVPTEPLTVPPELGVDHFAAFPTEWPRRIIQGWTPAGICVACGEGRRPVTETQAQPGLTGELVETRRREPGYEQTQQIAAFIREHRESAGLTHRQVDEACGTNTSASWWEGRKNGVQLPGPALWRRLKAVLSLPDTWDHLMLDTYMRPTGTMASGPALISGRHQTTGHTRLRSSDLITGYACGCPTPNAPTRPAVVLDPFGGTGTVALVADILGRHAIHVDLSHDYNRLARWRIHDPDQRARAARVDKPPPVIDGQLDLLAEGAS